MSVCYNMKYDYLTLSRSKGKGMLFNFYKEFVKDRARLTDDEAVKVIDAVFEVLGQRIAIEQAEQLAQTLPVEIREHLVQNPWPRPFGQREFISRVAEKEKVDHAAAATHTRAVLSVLAEFVPSAELLDALDHIPKDIQVFFKWQPQ